MEQKNMPENETMDMFIYKLISNNSIEKISEKVSAACEKHKFSLLQTYDYFEILENKGFPINRKVFIYEICQARVASVMLTEKPEFSIFMPCKLAIYENEGQTVISTMNMEIMLNAVKSNQILYNDAQALFATLKLLMHSLSNN